MLEESKADNILDDTQLIVTLEISKATGQEILVKMAESIELEERIDAIR